MSFFWFKSEPCNHPLDSIEVFGDVIQENFNKQHNRNYITFLCRDCGEKIDRSWDSMTPEYKAMVGAHITNIENTILFGSTKRDE